MPAGGLRGQRLSLRPGRARDRTGNRHGLYNVGLKEDLGALLFIFSLHGLDTQERLQQV